jgi:hypothetical protein
MQNSVQEVDKSFHVLEDFLKDGVQGRVEKLSFPEFRLFFPYRQLASHFSIYNLVRFFLFCFHEDCICKIHASKKNGYFK